MYKHVVARYFVVKLSQVQEKKYLRVDYAMLWWTPFLHSEKFYQTWILKRPSVIISTIYILMEFLTFSCTPICLIRHRVYIFIMRKILHQMPVILDFIWICWKRAKCSHLSHNCLYFCTRNSFFFKYMINCKWSLNNEIYKNVYLVVWSRGNIKVAPPPPQKWHVAVYMDL